MSALESNVAQPYSIFSLSISEGGPAGTSPDPAAYSTERMLSPSEQSASWPRTLQMRASLDVLQPASALLQPFALGRPTLCSRYVLGPSGSRL